MKAGANQGTARISKIPLYFKTRGLRKRKTSQLDDLALSAKFSLLDDKVLLAQTGYLTIKTVRGTTVTLGYPNREVSVSMARLYAEVILDKKAINRAGEGYLADYLEKGDLPAFVKKLTVSFLELIIRLFLLQLKPAVGLRYLLW